MRVFGLIKAGALALLAFAASLADPAFAKGVELWEGSWRTEHGALELDQRGRFVIGDFRDGDVFEGITSRDEKILRGRITTDRGSIIYVALQMDMDAKTRFQGRWARSSEDVPQVSPAMGRRAFAGERTSRRTPSVDNFAYTPSTKAYWDRTPLTRKSWAFFGRNWQLDPPLRAADVGTAEGLAAHNRPTAAEGVFGHIPLMEDFPAGYSPRFVEFQLRTVESNAADRRHYGTAGLYAFCDMPGSSRPLRMLGNLPHRVYDVPRNRSARYQWLNDNDGTRRFELPPSCLANKNARIRFELRTNFAERRLRGDDRFGTNSVMIYLDQMPTAADGMSPDRAIERTQAGEWQIGTGIQAGRRGVRLAIALPGTARIAFSTYVRLIE